MHDFSIQFALRCFIHLSSITTIFGAACVVKPSSSLAQFITFIGIVFTVFVVFILVRLAKRDLLKKVEDDYERLKVYLNGMKVCAFIALTTFIFVWNSFLIRSVLFFTLNFTFICLYCLFSFIAIYSWIPAPFPCKVKMIIGIILHIFFYTTTIYYSVVVVTKSEEYQLGFYLLYNSFVLATTSACENTFWEMVGMIWQSGQTSRPLENRHQNPECGICYHVYNNSNRIPRLLRECGHSVCEECIRKLITFATNSLSCPICRRIYLVKPGWATDFPMDFMMSEIIRK